MFTPLTFVLAMVPAVLHLLLCLRMSISRLREEFPCFFFYSAFRILRFIALFGIYQIFGYNAYFYCFWPIEFFSGLLMVAVIYEIFGSVFFSFAALQQLAKLLFNWSAGLLILLAVAIALVTPGPDSTRLIQAILGFEQLVTFVACGLVLLLLLMGMHFQLRWNRYTFGTVVGLSLYLIVKLAGVMVRRQYGDAVAEPFSLLVQVAYTCAAGLWIMTFFSRERAASASVDADLAQLQRWNDALAGMLRS